jgi:hypothetical protein
VDSTRAVSYSLPSQGPANANASDAADGVDKESETMANETKAHHFYGIRYEDGDEEDMTFSELQDNLPLHTLKSLANRHHLILLRLPTDPARNVL